MALPFHRAFPDHFQLVQCLREVLYADQGHGIPYMLRMARTAGIGDPERVAKLLTCGEANTQVFYGARRLRHKLSAQALQVCGEGSGAVGKRIHVAICCRFERQGMRWTRLRANRLLKLRFRQLDRAA